MISEGDEGRALMGGGNSQWISCESIIGQSQNKKISKKSLTLGDFRCGQRSEGGERPESPTEGTLLSVRKRV